MNSRSVEGVAEGGLALFFFKFYFRALFVVLCEGFVVS